MSARETQLTFSWGLWHGSQADLVPGSYSDNPAYNIDAQQNSHQEPTYEIIPSDAN